MVQARCTYGKTSESTKGEFVDEEQHSVKSEDTYMVTIAVIPGVRMMIASPWVLQSQMGQEG